MTTYRVVTTDSREPSNHATIGEAMAEIARREGWAVVVCSDRFNVGSREGTRGSVYGVECYDSQENMDARPDGDPYAPRILIIDGDESWAMASTNEEGRMFLTEPEATNPMLVRFVGSNEMIRSPYRPGDGAWGEPAFRRAARWAMTLASGRDPGKLYSRNNGAGGGIAVWTHRKIQTPMVDVFVDGADPKGDGK